MIIVGLDPPAPHLPIKIRTTLGFIGHRAYNLSTNRDRVGLGKSMMMKGRDLTVSRDHWKG